MMQRRNVRGVLLVLVAMSLSSCIGCRREPQPGAEPPEPTAERAVTPAPEEGTEVEWELTSAAFTQGERIPVQHTRDGQDQSPPLEWTSPPEGTAELVLICDDPDAPGGTWNHWIVYDLSPEATSLPEGVGTDAAVAEPALKQGVTSFGSTGYGGPSPPPGPTHRYQFTLYAVSAETDLEAGASKEQVLAVIEGKVLAETMLEGTYSR